MIKLTDQHMKILVCLTKQYRWWTTAELMEATDIPISKLFTAMNTLLSRGHVVRQNPTGLKWQFSLSPDIAKSLGLGQRQIGVPQTSHLLGTAGD